MVLNLNVFSFTPSAVAEFYINITGTFVKYLCECILSKPLGNMTSDVSCLEVVPATTDNSAHRSWRGQRGILGPRWMGTTLGSLTLRRRGLLPSLGSSRSNHGICKISG